MRCEKPAMGRVQVRRFRVYTRGGIDPPRGVAGLNGVELRCIQPGFDRSKRRALEGLLGRRQHCWGLACKTNRVRQISLLEVGLCGNFSRVWGRTSPVRT